MMGINPIQMVTFNKLNGKFSFTGQIDDFRQPSLYLGAVRHPEPVYGTPL